MPSGEPRESISDRVREDLEVLCSAVPDRRPGSAGNHEAVEYVADRLAEAGCTVRFQEFPCLDWETQGGTLSVGDRTIELTPSPYGIGVKAAGPIRVVREVAELGRDDLDGSILVLTGGLASEPLTPKAFPFYGSDEHEVIIAALEAAVPAAVIAVTGKYPELCGALDPFPLIEDGDFSIPTANVRPEAGETLVKEDGRPATVEIRSIRKPSRARNVIGSRGSQTERITVIAHIDAKPGTPGAVDNGAGVVVLLVLARLLAEHPDLPIGVELLAVNGEDHFAAPGELAWLSEHGDALEQIPLVVNIDGAGYRGGRSAFSKYNLDDELGGLVDGVFAGRDSFIEGPDWYQSDHAIFAMRGRPVVAITTEHVQEMLSELFHSPADTPDQVDPKLVV
ncbi:MAG: M28 family peptidase, partial [Acidimicrobiia bacterium]|nr:M28 family peptidase [Acidimicrobiia bacterium]